MIRILIRLAILLSLLQLAANVSHAQESGKKPTKEERRLDDAKAVYQELAASEVPKQLLEKCKCVAVVPGVVKGALGFGGRHGKGVLSCRDAAGTWSPPIFLTLSGGSFGLQIGVEKADVVLFFMNEKGARSLVESKFTLSGKAGVAAGPVGRTGEAATDIKLNAEIYSYAKSKGLFAGISLEGSRLAPDNDALKRFYGESARPDAILFQQNAPSRPASIQPFLQVLP
ncbi:MAG TPA: lipid-binding SYLF domain-containing protein [Candidatus Eisenbacteria bacterium]|nr:lipid-binding SYLF domain-containing protein [Candidatus Eisenbacteria bacterium]